MLHVLWLVIVQRTVRRLLLPGLDPMDRSSSADNQANGNGEKWYNPLANVGTFALIAYILFVVFSSLFILTPLEVMTTRLTIQVRVRFIFSSNRLKLIFFPSVITNQASAPSRRRRALTSNMLVEMRMLSPYVQRTTPTKVSSIVG